MPMPWRGFYRLLDGDGIGSHVPVTISIFCTVGHGHDQGVVGVRGDDMRKGFDGLAVLVQQALEQSPHSGALFAFRGKRGHLVKLLWYDGQGMCLFSKRLGPGSVHLADDPDRQRVALTAAQLSMLLEGIDWRRPERTWSPSLAG